MLSRVADCIYWMNAYLERAENVARFVDVNLNLTLDLGGGVREQWEPLVFTTGDHAAFVEHYGAADLPSVVEFLTFDRRNPNSILACLQAARENARSIREIIPSPLWEELNKFYLSVRAAAHGDRSTIEPYEFFQQVRRSSQLLVGISETTMSRGEAWHFARLGRLLERADKTSRILDVKYYLLLPSLADVGSPLDVVQWSALLKSTSALETYRKHRGRISPEEVVDFLVLDRDFPRAMRYCLIRAEESLHAITGTPASTFRNPAERRLGQLRAELDYTQVTELIQQGLHEFIDAFQIKLNRVGAAIFQAFFAMQPVAAAVGVGGMK